MSGKLNLSPAQRCAVLRAVRCVALRCARRAAFIHAGVHRRGMDSTDLDNALQQIGMLSESAVVVDDRGQRKPSKGVTSPSKPAQQQTHASPHTRTPLSTTAARRRKGKHRKPKPNLQQPSTTTKNLNVENSTSEEGSDDEYFYPPLKPTQREKEDNGEIDTDSDQDNDDEDGGNDQFDEYELQLAMQMSAMVNRAEGVELVSEQYKYRANIYTRQHVLVQLDEDKYLYYFFLLCHPSHFSPSPLTHQIHSQHMIFSFLFYV